MRVWELKKIHFFENLLYNSTKCQKNLLYNSTKLQKNCFIPFYFSLKFKTRFSQNPFFQDRSHFFSKTIAPISLKFCTLLLNMFVLSLNEGFSLSSILTHFISKTMAKKYAKNDIFMQHFKKNSIFNILKNPSFKDKPYSYTNRKKLVFSFQITNDRNIVTTMSVLFLAWST